MKKLTIAKDQTTNQCGMNWEAVCQLNAGNAPDGASTTQRRTQNFGEKCMFRRKGIREKGKAKWWGKCTRAIIHGSEAKRKTQLAG
jgi:hypothetical protein